MRQVTVFLNDYPSKRRVSVAFNSVDIERVETTWDEENDQLLGFQSIPAFTGYRKWSQCRSEHFRVLIARTLVIMEGLSDTDRADTAHPAVSTLNFLTLGLVKCLEDASQSTIELMRIHRISATDIGYDYTAVMDMKFAPPPSLADSNPFTIVVDNTK